MLAITIRAIVVEFLEKYPPFDKISKTDLEDLCNTVKIKYLTEGKALFLAGDQVHNYFYVVKKGAMSLSHFIEGREELIDLCDEGDIFGVRAIISKTNYLMTAVAKEDSLMYAIPADHFIEIMENNLQVSLFLAANFASGVPIKHNSESSFSAQIKFYSQEQSLFKPNLKSVFSDIKHFTCAETASIWDCAKLMTEQKTNIIIIVNEKLFPIGMVSDSDLRRKAIVPMLDLQEKVGIIMNRNVVTVRENQTFAEMMILMLSKKVRYLCLTNNGSKQSKIKGMVSDYDIFTSLSENPAFFIKKIAHTKSISDLAEQRNKADILLENYLKQNLGIDFISQIISEINDQVFKKAVEFAIKNVEILGYEQPDSKFCFLVLGSSARKEMLLKNEFSNALIYENTESQYVQDYFLVLSQEVNKILLQCGFKQFEQNLTAENPIWCQPLHIWEKYLKNWTEKQEDYEFFKSAVFLDFRKIYGDSLLAKHFQKLVKETCQKNDSLLAFLSKNSLQNPPPLSFFRNFVVEKEGKYKNEFDIQSRAIQPLVDSVRALSLAENCHQKRNTQERLQKIGLQNPNLQELCLEVSNAYGILLKYSTLSGLQNQDSGKYLSIDSLSKLERQLIRKVFSSIHELQKVLKKRVE